MTDADADPNAPLPARNEQVGACASCGAPLVPDQRYCLQCGARRGAARLDFTGFWRRASATGQSAGSAAGAETDASGGGAPGRDRPPRLPSRKWSIAITCAVLGVGIAVGDALGPGPASSLASDASSLPVGVLGAIASAQSAQSSKAAAASEPAESTSSSGVEAEEPEEESAASSEAPAEGAEGGEEEVAEAAPDEGEEEAEKATGGGSGGSGGSKKSSSATETPVSAAVLAQVTHVWVVMLSGSSFKLALAKSASDPYLSKQLVPKGTLLSNYSLVAASPLANDVALLSGQSGNAATEEDCPTYEAIEPPTLEAKGLTEGVGCIYPAAAKTLADQTTEAALTWKAYVQDMAPAAAASTSTTASVTTSATASESTTTSTTSSATTTTSESPTTSPLEASTQICRHPAIGGTEPAQTPVAGDDYLLYRNPFVFFDSLLESGACGSDDVDLTALKPDLAEPKTVPSLNWIVPAACDDGEPTGCGPKGSTGLAAADDFLHEVVPEILASKDYKEHGLILITFDTGPSGKSKSSEAGASVGALLISPFVKRNGTDSREFDTYALLKSLERLYGVPLLGHANDKGLEELGAGVYSTTAKAAQAAASSRHGATQPSG